MLEKIIEMVLEEYDKAENFNNEDINNWNGKVENMVLSIKNKIGDKEYFELDSLIGSVCCVYKDVFFKEGFKKGLELSREIDK